MSNHITNYDQSGNILVVSKNYVKLKNFSQAAGPAHRQQLQGLLSFNPDLLSFRIYSPTGQELFASPPTRPVLLPDETFILAAYSAVIDPLATTIYTDDGQRLLAVVAPAFGPAGQKVPYVRYLFTFQSVEQKLQEMRQTFLLIALLAAVCSLVLVALVAKRFTLPIHRLIEGVRAVSSGQLETSIQAHGSDELATLWKVFNEMAASLSLNQKELQEKNVQLQEANAEL